MFSTSEKTELGRLRESRRQTRSSYARRTGKSAHSHILPLDSKTARNSMKPSARLKTSRITPILAHAGAEDRN
jgi:hypothetical protein